MRKLIAFGVLVVLFAGLGSGTAAAGQKKLVEGTVYDTTCVAVCMPECPPPPHCGPVPVTKSRSAVICAQASIERGSTTVFARLPIVEGHFKIWLGPGQYVFHPYLAEEQCWSAEPVTAAVTPRSKSPVPVTLDVTNRCVVHAN